MAAIPAAPALPALGQAAVPALSNAHTQGRLPGADNPDLTFRTSGIFGREVQEGANNTLTKQVIEANKGLYVSQTFKSFVIKLLHFWLLIVHEDDIVKFLFAGQVFNQLESIIRENSLRATVSKIQGACFGDGNSSFYDYVCFSNPDHIYY